ncbi:MAG: hypothetical protein C4K47_05820 [Candidatus Thorarchaeota archaeon]|nr:MAG: hypothetical protein C4K47_05820 [Candidatus Thorarchaeota archaeon]
MVRKIFGRGKKDTKEEKEEEEESIEEQLGPREIEAPYTPPSPNTPIEVAPSVAEKLSVDKLPTVGAKESKSSERGGTVPYHNSLPDRLKYFSDDQSAVKGLESTDSFTLGFLAMGDRFKVEKEPMGPIKVEPGMTHEEDAFIRVSNEAVAELLSAASFKEFSDVYMHYYRNAGPGKFVKIELREDISSLNKRGFARVPILKLLIGTAR